MATIIIITFLFLICSLIKKFSDFRREHGYGRIFKKYYNEMKTKNITIIILLGIMMIACAPSKSEQHRIIQQYSNNNNLFIAKIDSSDIELQVMASDKYEAMKYFDQKLKEGELDRSYKIEEYPIELLP